MQVSGPAGINSISLLSVCTGTGTVLGGGGGPGGAGTGAAVPAGGKAQTQHIVHALLCGSTRDLHHRFSSFVHLKSPLFLNFSKFGACKWTFSLQCSDWCRVATLILFACVLVPVIPQTGLPGGAGLVPGAGKKASKLPGLVTRGLCSKFQPNPQSLLFSPKFVYCVICSLLDLFRCWLAWSSPRTGSRPRSVSCSTKCCIK